MTLMTLAAVSSFRPLRDSQEIARNQIVAKHSWEGIFDHIVYFGSYEPRLASPKTTFIETKDFPPLSLMALAATFFTGYACIINSDIVVTDSLYKAIYRARNKGALAFMSRRFEFDPLQRFDARRAEMVDGGLDFFGALPWLWKRFYRAVPEQFRIGHPVWDNWANAFFSHTAREGFYDLTNYRGVFHPRHQNRKRPHHISIKPDAYLQKKCPSAVMLF